jgi:hypothetical protein
VTPSLGASIRCGGEPSRYPPRVTDTARRIPHVFPRSELAWLLAPTYADSLAVDEEIAVERLERALQNPEILAGIHGALAAALEETRGPRTDPEAQVDRVHAGGLGRDDLAEPGHRDGARVDAGHALVGQGRGHARDRPR